MWCDTKTHFDHAKNVILAYKQNVLYHAFVVSQLKKYKTSSQKNVLYHFLLYHNQKKLEFSK